MHLIATDAFIRLNFQKDCAKLISNVSCAGFGLDAKIADGLVQRCNSKGLRTPICVTSNLIVRTNTPPSDQ